MVTAAEHKAKTLKLILTSAVKGDLTNEMALTELHDLAVDQARRVDILHNRLNKLMMNINGAILDSFGVSLPPEEYLGIEKETKIKTWETADAETKKALDQMLGKVNVNHLTVLKGKKK